MVLIYEGPSTLSAMGWRFVSRVGSVVAIAGCGCVCYGVGGGRLLANVTTIVLANKLFASYDSGRVPTPSRKKGNRAGGAFMVPTSAATSKGAAGMLLATRDISRKAVAALGGNLIGSKTAR